MLSVKSVVEISLSAINYGTTHHFILHTHFLYILARSRDVSNDFLSLTLEVLHVFNNSSVEKKSYWLFYFLRKFTTIGECTYLTYHD